MEIIKFLEKIATNSHNQINIDSLMASLPIEIKNAYQSNDIESLKSFLSNDSYLANESHVVKIHS